MEPSQVVLKDILKKVNKECVLWDSLKNDTKIVRVAARSTSGKNILHIQYIYYINILYLLHVPKNCLIGTTCKRYLCYVFMARLVSVGSVDEHCWDDQPKSACLGAKIF